MRKGSTKFCFKVLYQVVMIFNGRVINHPPPHFFLPASRRCTSTFILPFCRQHCDEEYHTYCLQPPLSEVPSGKWFCDNCMAKGFDVPDGKGRGGARGKGSQDGSGGIRGTKPATPKNAAPTAAAMVATRASPRAAAAAAAAVAAAATAAAAANKDSLPPSKSGAVSSPGKIGLVVGYSNNKAGAGVEAAVAAPVGRENASKSQITSVDGAFSASGAAAVQGGVVLQPGNSESHTKQVSAAAGGGGVTGAAPQQGLVRPRKEAAVAAGEAGLPTLIGKLSADGEQQPTAHTKPSTDRSPVCVERIVQGWTGEAFPISLFPPARMNRPPGSGRGDRGTRGGRSSSGGGIGGESPSHDPLSPTVKSQMGRPPNNSPGSGRSRSGGRGSRGGDSFRKVVNGVVDSQGKIGQGSGSGSPLQTAAASAVVAAAVAAVTLNDAPEEGRRKKKRLEQPENNSTPIGLIRPTRTPATIDLTLATDLPAAMATAMLPAGTAAIVDSYSSNLSSVSSSSLTSVLVAASAPTLPIAPRGDGGEMLAAACDSHPLGWDTSAPPPATNSEARPRKRAHVERVEVAVTEEIEGKRKEGAGDQKNLFLEGRKGAESAATTTASPIMASQKLDPPAKPKNSHHKNARTEQEEDVLDGHKFKRRRGSAPEITARTEVCRERQTGDIVDTGIGKGDGGGGGTDVSAAVSNAGGSEKVRTLSGREAWYGRGRGGGRSKVRGRGGRPSVSSSSKATVENDYSRPRLNHRAPPPSSPLASGNLGGSGTSGSVVPTRRSKRKVN